MTPDGTTVLCEVSVPENLGTETQQILDAALQVRTAMVAWHNREIKNIMYGSPPLRSADTVLDTAQVLTQDLV